ETVLPRHAPTYVGSVAGGLKGELNVVGAFERPDEIELDANEIARAALDDGHTALTDRLTAARPAELRPPPPRWPFERVLGIGIHLRPWRPGFPFMKIVHLRKNRLRRRVHRRRPRHAKLTRPRRNIQRQNRNHRQNTQQNIYGNHDSFSEYSVSHM